MGLGGQPGLAGCPGTKCSGSFCEQGSSWPGRRDHEQLTQEGSGQGPAMAADRYGQPGQPAPNGRNSPRPGFRLELPIPRGALAIELSQRPLQLRSESFRQTYGWPAPIPTGSREIPEHPLPAQETPIADLADLQLQPTPGTRRHQGHRPTNPFGSGANKQRTCHGIGRQRTAQPGAARTRGALAPRVSPWPAAQAEEGRRRFGGVSERPSPTVCPSGVQR